MPVFPINTVRADFNLMVQIAVAERLACVLPAFGVLPAVQQPLQIPGSVEKPMDKIQIGQNFFIPMPVVLVGTQVSGIANFMTVGWAHGQTLARP